MTLENQLLSVLLFADKSTATLAMEVPGRSVASVRSAMYRLYDKGHVERYGWPVVWTITRKGADQLEDTQ